MNLTKGAIKSLFQNFEDKQDRTLDITVQVTKASEPKETKSVVLQTLKLHDGQHVSMTCIYTFKGDNPKELRDNDIIRVSLVKFQTQNKGDKKKICFLNKFDVLSNANMVIGNPIELSESEILGSNKEVHQNYDETHTDYMELRALSTFSKDFTIKVRCNKKTDMKHYKNAKGDGNLFSFVVIDSTGTEMQVTCFNKVAQDIYNTINEGHVYRIKGGSVKMNDRKYNAINNDYKLILDEFSEVVCLGDTADNDIPYITYDFTPIKDIESLNAGRSVDIIAKVISCEDKRTIRTKSDKEMNLRKIKVGDDSGYIIEFTLWNEHADASIAEGDYIGVKNAKVGDFNGKNLGTVSDTTISIKPDCDRLQIVQNYFNNNAESLKQIKGTTEVNRNYETCFIKEMKNELDTITDGNYPFYKFLGTLSSLPLRDRNFYKACPECKKKVVEDGYGYKCESCNKNIDEPNLTYTLSLCFKDGTDQVWVDLFGALGEKLLNKTAKEYSVMHEQGNEDELNKMIKAATFRKYLITVKPKIDSYNDQMRKRYSLIRLDLVEDTNDLMRERNKLLQKVLGL